jgi:hypothetical protein
MQSVRHSTGQWFSHLFSKSDTCSFNAAVICSALQSVSRSIMLLLIYLFVYLLNYFVQLLCALSQFICHIKTVRYRTVQFSMKAVPDTRSSLAHSNTTVYLCIYQSLNFDDISFKRQRAPLNVCLLLYKREVRHLNVMSILQLISFDVVRTVKM